MIQFKVWLKGQREAMRYDELEAGMVKFPLLAKDFVQEILAGTERALLAALKGGQGVKRMATHLTGR